MRTFLGIPLTVSDTVFGVLSVQSARENAYSADQIQFMENVAIQASLAIDKTRLLDQLTMELRERRMIEIDLRQRESILEAVTFAAEQFLETSDWRHRIEQVLERLGTTIHVTHAYLFEDHISVASEPVTSMRYEWTAPGYASDLDNPEFQNSAINEHGYEDLIEAMSRGDLRARNSSTFTPVEKNAMDRMGVKAILEVPIFESNQEWGAMGFDDLEQERIWSGAEVDALKIASGVLGAAIQRQQADASVQESERIYRRAIEAAYAVPYYRDTKSSSYLFIGQGALERGDFDMALNGLEITPEKKRSVLFSLPYYIYTEQLAVRKNDDRIKGTFELPGRTVGTLSGSVAQDILQKIPNVEVRIFNPFYSRKGLLPQISEIIFRGGRLNRRMHNKAWIVDNRIAIVGGRNVGDEYFGASEISNFNDLDVVLAGAAVEQVSHEFDVYWNSVHSPAFAGMTTYYETINLKIFKISIGTLIF